MNETVDAAKRLDCLSRTCLALGTALDGLGRMKNPPAEEVKALAEQLLMTTRQTTWLARTMDPYYVPKDRIAEAVGRARMDRADDPVNGDDPCDVKSP